MKRHVESQPFGFKLCEIKAFYIIYTIFNSVGSLIQRSRELAGDKEALKATLKLCDLDTLSAHLYLASAVLQSRGGPIIDCT